MAQWVHTKIMTRSIIIKNEWEGSERNDEVRNQEIKYS